MRQISLILLFIGIGAIESIAQPVVTPRNIALGGGGSTYITDYNANFYNPANLMIQDREGSFTFGIGSGSFLTDIALNYTDLNKQFHNVKNYIKPYEENESIISEAERTEILENNYPNNSHLSDNKIRYDVTLIGMKWMKNNQAISIAVRSRTSSSFKAGRGWYSNTFVENSDDKLILDRSLIHRFQSLHEISFGYAESFQFLTGLTPRLDNFIIGIAPKFVVAGNYHNAVWENIYEQTGQANTTNRTASFAYNATGDFGSSTMAYFNGATPESAASDAFNTDLLDFSVNGIGAGLDIGVTYLLTLGSDLSAIRPEQQPTQRSLRLSFAMTDIGFVSYNKDEISISTQSDTINGVIAPSNISNEIFTGRNGQYIDFIEKFGEDNPFDPSQRNLSAFSTLLPMALHGGALLEINRLKLMGDVSVGLTNNAFNSTKLISSIGIELRPLTFLPLRGGIQFKAQRPNFISLGTAIETKKWDLSLAAQLTPNSLTTKPTVTGVTVATLQFHF